MSWLADEGYDPVFGARPLKRVIQRALQDPLAEMLLAGRVSASNRPTPDDAVVH
jgi:ATP-dependent Clp protease ATP-binding subunit ClpB